MLTQTELHLIDVFSNSAIPSADKGRQLQWLLSAISDAALEESADRLARSQKQLEDPDDPYWLTLLEVKKLLQNEGNRRKLKKYGLLSDSDNAPQSMTGAELASMLKSNVRFKSTDGIKCAELKLPAGDMSWWQDAKLGMFIHWGVYSVIGHGEWAMHNEQIPAEEYRRQAMDFSPKQFDADRWAELAQNAGMKYMVMVTRHHDGFAMWDSAASYGSFTTMQAAAHCDFVQLYTEAARRHGLRVGLYYSPMDWRFPGYFEPMEQMENALLMKEQLYGQIEELLTRYGPIDILWYDGSWLAHRGSDAGGAWLWEPLKLNGMVRKLNSKVVMNERSGWEGDFSCDEGPHKVTGSIIPFPWEKSFSLAGSWAWKPGSAVMDFAKVMELLINVFVRNGNALLNITPDRDGVVPENQVELLRRIGGWMGEYGESVYGTRGGPFEPVDGVYGSTCRDNAIYIHILDMAEFQRLGLPALPQQVTACRVLGGQPVAFSQTEQGIELHLTGAAAGSGHDHDFTDTIVKLTLSE
ncbi:MAG: hypothetical protein K0R57_3048 [Paenibacillaceae bacterium]|jgi:alpha-L-fucosidase|nr:hypothetical protein [Paenibacillaceae bacterium]